MWQRGIKIMTLKTIATGSTGNCYILTSDSGKHLILDAGIPIAEIKKLLPQYVIARKPTKLIDEQQTMLNHKKDEFNCLCGK